MALNIHKILANTLLDPELFAFTDYLNDPANGGRNAKVYSVRTLPYKTHSTASTDDQVKKDAERIKKNMVAQSTGVLRNIIDNPASPGRPTCPAAL